MLGFFAYHQKQKSLVCPFRLSPHRVSSQECGASTPWMAMIIPRFFLFQVILQALLLLPAPSPGFPPLLMTAI